jgi:hypothetical protein
MKISIEYAHIYTHQQIDEEHKLSLKVLRETLGNSEHEKNDASLVVLVDDYSFPDPTFDYVSFTKWLETEGYKPDLVIRESQLIPSCDVVLKLLENSKLALQITDYIKTKKKYPCSLFIAAWYLLRLGKIQSELFPTELQSQALINILPESFKPFEEKAVEIIDEAGFNHKVGDIQYKFMPGRLAF